MRSVQQSVGVLLQACPGTNEMAATEDGCAHADAQSRNHREDAARDGYDRGRRAQLQDQCLRQDEDAALEQHQADCQDQCPPLCGPDFLAEFALGECRLGTDQLAGLMQCVPRHLGEVESCRGCDRRSEDHGRLVCTVCATRRPRELPMADSWNVSRMMTVWPTCARRTGLRRSSVSVDFGARRPRCPVLTDPMWHSARALMRIRGKERRRTRCATGTRLAKWCRGVERPQRTQGSTEMRLAKTLLTIGSIIGAREAIRAAQVIDLDDLLGVIGLQRRRGRAERILPALAMVAVGAAVGAGAALLLAPSSGADLRHRISEGAGNVKERVSEKVSEFERKLQAEQEKAQAA